MRPIAFARALTCAGASLLAAPSEARFLQVDPVGYADQINLYAYVRNDPLRFRDPSGRCTIVSTPDGPRPLGFCPVTGDQRAIGIYQQNRQIFEKYEKSAVNSGWLFGVRSGAQDREGRPIAGAATNVLDRPNTGEIWFDPDDRSFFRGRNTGTNEFTDYEMPMDEIVYHEVGGHAAALIGGELPGSTDDEAVAAENAYRQQKGIEVERLDHFGWTEPQAPRPDPPDCTGTRICPN